MRRSAPSGQRPYVCNRRERACDNPRARSGASHCADPETQGGRERHPERCVPRLGDTVLDRGETNGRIVLSEAQEVRNERAVFVYRRVQDKLTGTSSRRVAVRRPGMLTRARPQARTSRSSRSRCPSRWTSSSCRRPLWRTCASASLDGARSGDGGWKVLLSYFGARSRCFTAYACWTDCAI